MTQFDPVALAIDWHDVCKRNDCNALTHLYAGDATATVPVDGSGHAGTVLRGRGEIAAYWQAAFSRAQPATFELVEIYPGVNSAILIYYDEQCQRVSEFLQFNEVGLIATSARHVIPRRRQEPAVLAASDSSPMRKAMLRCEARQTLTEARRLPLGPTRNNLRQRAVALKALAKKACSPPSSDLAIG